MDEISQSPLYSPDLAPIPADKRTWNKLNLAALWVGMAVCIPTYLLASYMMRAGLSWQAALTIIGLANLVITVPMVLAQERLKRYTQILRAQFQDLDMENFRIEHDLRQQLNLRGRITPKVLLRHVDADVAALDGEIRRLEGEIAIPADLKTLKLWLKTFRAPRRQEAWGGFPF